MEKNKDKNDKSRKFLLQHHNLCSTLSNKYFLNFVLLFFPLDKAVLKRKAEDQKVQKLLVSVDL